MPASAEKVALVEPAATVTDAGTVNAVELLESETTSPPVGAACESVTVQVDCVPELRDVGLQDRVLSEGQMTLKVAPTPLTGRSFP